VRDNATRHLNLWDDLPTLCVLGTYDIDGRKQRRDRGKQARFCNVSARADAPAEAETGCTWVTDGRVERAIRSEITGWVEGVGVRIVLWIV
jgi:hypothetical protein